MNQRRRLRVVDHHNVLAKLHALAILFVVHQENFLRGLGQLIRRAVQRVVKCLGDFEKIITAGDHIPVGGHIQFRQKRDKTIQHLRYTAADRGRIDHLDCFFRQIARQETQGIDLSPPMMFL